MKEIKASELSDNMFDAIGKEWMLVAAGTPDRFNVMTASWGGIGWLWNRPVAFVFIRPERYTYEFVENGDTLTLSFVGESHKDVHKVCGFLSGRDTDKVAAAGLEPVATAEGNVTFRQSRLTLECRKLYADDLRPERFLDQGLVSRWYGPSHGGFHRMYVVEIEHVWVDEQDGHRSGSASVE